MNYISCNIWIFGCCDVSFLFWKNIASYFGTMLYKIISVSSFNFAFLCSWYVWNVVSTHRIHQCIFETLFITVYGIQVFNTDLNVFTYLMRHLFLYFPIHFTFWVVWEMRRIVVLLSFCCSKDNFIQFFSSYFPLFFCCDGDKSGQIA